MDFVLEYFPNNEIRFGVQSVGSRKRQYGDNSQSAMKERLDTHHGNILAEVIQGNSGGVIMNQPGKGKYNLVAGSELERFKLEQSGSLDIIRKFQASKKKEIRDGNSKHGRSGYGLLGRSTRFTRSARRRILGAGNLLARRCPEPDKSTFVTLTVPGAAPWVGGTIARWASYLVNRVLQVVRDSNRREGVGISEWFYSWENQKRGVLHLHLVIWNKTSGVSLGLGYRVREAWYSALKSLSGKDGHCVFTTRRRSECWLSQHWQSDVCAVERSVAAYVSKYISKADKTCSVRGGILYYSPPRWSGMSRSLSLAVRQESGKLTITGLTENTASHLYEAIALWFEKHQVVSFYQYSFDLESSGYHIGSGFRTISYAKEGYQDAALSNLVDFIRVYFNSLRFGVVSGTGVLYRQIADFLAPNPEVHYDVFCNRKTS